MNIRPDVADSVVRALLRFIVTTEQQKDGDRLTRHALRHGREALNLLKRSRERSLQDQGALEGARHTWEHQAVIFEEDAPVIRHNGMEFVQAWVPVQQSIVPPVTVDRPPTWALYINDELIDDTYLTDVEAWNSREARGARAADCEVRIEMVPAEPMD